MGKKKNPNQTNKQNNNLYYSERTLEANRFPANFTRKNFKTGFLEKVFATKLWDRQYLFIPCSGSKGTGRDGKDISEKTKSRSTPANGREGGRGELIQLCGRVSVAGQGFAGRFRPLDSSRESTLSQGRSAKSTQCYRVYDVGWKQNNSVESHTEACVQTASDMLVREMSFALDW